MDIVSIKCSSCNTYLAENINMLGFKYWSCYHCTSNSMDSRRWGHIYIGQKYMGFEFGYLHYTGVF